MLIELRRSESVRIRQLVIELIELVYKIEFLLLNSFEMSLNGFLVLIELGVSSLGSWQLNSSNFGLLFRSKWIFLC